jgi:hypothetical protein
MLRQDVVPAELPLIFYGKNERPPNERYPLSEVLVD